MNDTLTREVRRARHRVEVGRAAAARVISESAAGDCHDREAILQAVCEGMAQLADEIVYVRMVSGGAGFEPFPIDEFREEFETCVEDDPAAVRAGAIEVIEAYLRGVALRSTRIH